MTFEEALIARLFADVAVDAILEDRIYPQQAAQGSIYPLATYRIQNDRPIWTIDQGPTTTRNATLRIDCHDTTYGTAKDVAQAVDAALVGPPVWKGTVDAQLTMLGLLDNQAEDDIEPPAHGQETGIHKVSLSYQVWYRYSAA